MARAQSSPTPSLGQYLQHLLEGRPLGHPLHPLLVHLPIGLFTLSFVFDLSSRLLAPDSWLVQAAFYTLILGLLTGFVAALFGLIDWTSIRADHPGRPTANAHMLLNLLVLALYFVNAWGRTGALGRDQTPAVSLALSFVALALLFLSGYLGGRLVYDHGLAVGRHRRHTGLPNATSHAPIPRGPGEFVPVVDTRRLDHQETVRAEVNGYVMAIARVDDKYYAVQDFCTHRYGPLSDGRLCAGELECPWHRSRFDLSTGQPTQGPAKEALMTFETRVVDGQVEVKVPAEPPSDAQDEQQPAGLAKKDTEHAPA